MKRWLIAAVLSVIPAVGCAHGKSQPSAKAAPPTPSAQASPPPQHAAARPTGISLPSDAKVVATETVDEIRAFPEMRSQAQAQPSGVTQTQPSAASESVVRERAVDNVYETKKHYKDAVEFIDKQINKQGLTSLARVETRSATAWALDLGGGQIEQLVVRNTKPTTIETVAAAGTEVQLAP